MEDPNRITRLSQYRHDRSRFACIVYSLAVIFFAVSLLQWILMIVIEGLRDFIIDFYYISILALIISLLLVTAFVFFENLRFAAPLNWLITLIIVFATTWGLSRAIVEANTSLLLLAVLFVLILTVIFIMIGVCIGHDLTLDVVILFVVAVIFFVVSVFFVMLQILAGVKLAYSIYALFIIITVLMFMMYHAQTINGFRYAEMRINDFLLAALIIYHDMTLLLIMSFYFIAKFNEWIGGTGLRLFGESCCGVDRNDTERYAGGGMPFTDADGENKVAPIYL
ncbi:protein lifeguard 3-like [Eurosta solidaginis]|uniref:protein lifeguard 3-like n=1 Tax=Eurosta solidaginis TaxID=178769 RepID=UPI00353112D9